MYLKTFKLKNFRRLKNIKVDLEDKETVFVGANNSGKTSATYAFRLFLGSSKKKFKVYDFSSDCWDDFNKLTDENPPEAPNITLDLWFSVDDLNLHRVIDILPSLDWEGTRVGIRLSYQVKELSELISNFKGALAQKEAAGDEEPFTMMDYLERNLINEYEVAYYILDEDKFDDSTYEEVADYSPRHIESSKQGAELISSLLRVDFLDAQRHLSDSSDGARHESLSRRLAKYYSKNVEKPDVDQGAVSAIKSSEEKINAHLKTAFSPLLKGLNELGYPGVANPSPVIKTVLNIEDILNSGTEVHYALPSEESADAWTLPDQYNGLGFKNLIFMVVELLDFHVQWVNTADSRPPVHLVMIEEPEAHLHIQLQQVFIRKLFELVGEEEEGFCSQFVITTHSPHILYESNFKPIRYFARKNVGSLSLKTEVKDLSDFHKREDGTTLDFLQKYLKLTHCDLFFSDGAILVEGNVERLIVPAIIDRDVPGLGSCHLTLLEVGGAFAHKFEELVKFLEIPTLIITDLDSVAPGEPDEEQDEDEPDEGETYKPGNACPTSLAGAITSNDTLAHWFSSSSSIVDLLAVEDADKVVDKDSGNGIIRVAYQTQLNTSWNGSASDVVGRTLEEAFALENLTWSQDTAQKHLGLVIKNSASLTLADLHTKIFKRVKRSGFDKTKFALGLIASNPDSWSSPVYIVEGLEWLHGKLAPELVAADESSEAQEA